MSPRGRVFFLVTLAAVVASGVVVLGVLATRSHVAAAPKPRAGRPPLALDLGVRTDPEARALEQAQQLYKSKQAARAGEIFARYHSLEAQVGSAFAAWPSGSVASLQSLAAEHPQSSLVALHLGLAFYWTRRDAQAVTAWRAARRLQPDTYYAVRANDLLHPQYAPGLPGFVPSFPMPPAIRVLAPARRFAALRQAAERGGAHAKIFYGTALQQLGHPLSAERQFAAFSRAVDEAIKLHVDVVLVCGDLFDSNAQPRRSVERAAGELRRLADQGLQIGLAISLHAPNDELRSSLMPVNRRWPIAESIAARNATPHAASTRPPVRSIASATTSFWASEVVKPIRSFTDWR